MKNIGILFCTLILSACSSLEVATLDPKTGYFPSEKKAKAVTNKSINIDERKSVILVGDSEFEKNQMINIGFFDKVITIDDNC